MREIKMLKWNTPKPKPQLTARNAILLNDGIEALLSAILDETGKFFTWHGCIPRSFFFDPVHYQISTEV